MRGLTVIGVPESEAWPLVRKVGLDSMPKAPRAVLDLFAQDPGARLTTAEVGEALGLPTATVHRPLVDLGAHGVVRHSGRVYEWETTDLLRERWSATTELPSRPFTGVTRRGLDRQGVRT